MAVLAIRQALAKIQICTAKSPIHTDLSDLADAVAAIRFNRLKKVFGPWSA
jgi:hypothetical protein